jgi:hypothetical protein
MLNELEKDITVLRQGDVANGLPSSGQTVMKVTNYDTILDFLYLQSIRVTNVLLLLYD